MLRNVVEPIVRTASNFQHISILQGTKIYGVHLHPIPIPARERDRSALNGNRILLLINARSFLALKNRNQKKDLQD
jgi:hypothetical protein